MFKASSRFILFFTALSLPLPLSGAAPKLRLALVQRPPSAGHRQLSDDIENVRQNYKFIVVGSGYGASVIAHGITEALQRTGSQDKLAILERGSEWQPGDFPESLISLTGAVRSELNPLGLFSMSTHLNADMDVIGANGLGGTSLINAAITLRPPGNVWSLERWPEELKKDFESGALDGYYKRVEAMLLPKQDHKTGEFAKSQAHLANYPNDFPTGQLTLNINHEQGRENHGVVQNACTHCGNCVSGCNVGAKNTLTTNYLPAAKDQGAEIYTEVEVDYVEKLPPNHPSGRKWYVHYMQHKKAALGGLPLKKHLPPLATDNVFLGASSLGTTQILMRSVLHGLKVSTTLGTRVSANGDVMGMIYNTPTQTNIVAGNDAFVGQTITVYANYREFNKNDSIQKQFVLLDGSVPTAVATAASRALGAMMLPQSLGSLSAMGRIAKDMASPMHPPSDGALNHSLLLLACGHDTSSGRYVLDSNQNAYVVWPQMQDEESFQYISGEMKEEAKRMGGAFIANQRSEPLGGKKMQAPHPLGGAPTGDSVETGVVNHLGQVFDPDSPDGGVHDGLFVVDAAALTHSLAAPPLATISMWATRIVTHFVAWKIDRCESALNNLWPMK